MKIPKSIFSIHLPFVILSCIQSLSGVAQGNLLVTPRRIVFDGSKRSQELNLANVGKDTATFAISFIQIRMKEDGTFEKITEPDSAQYFADPFLRFFPRSVTLGPNEAQTVKVQITKSNELRPIEYRSHLYFRALPDEKPLGRKGHEGDKAISVQLVPVFGISIPIIIRKGVPASKVNLSDIVFQMQKDSLPNLQMTLNRTGDMSVYGDLFVDHISLQGKMTRIARVNGVAVYTPNPMRRFQLMLDKTRGIDYHKGKLLITYSDQSPKAEKLAEGEIALN